MEQADAPFLQDPAILVHPDRIIEFFPTASMAGSERLNAMARLVLAAGAAYSAYRGDAHYLQLGLVAVGLLAVLWSAQTVVPRESKAAVVVSQRKQAVSEDGPVPPLGQKPALEVAVENAPCQMPTPQNPFMNPTAMDGGGKLPACRGPGVQQMAENLLNEQLFADPTDLFGRKQMQRAFYTLPSTEIPEDRERWGRWLYEGGGGCKTDAEQCAPLDDLRRARALPTNYVEEQDALY